MDPASLDRWMADLASPRSAVARAAEEQLRSEPAAIGALAAAISDGPISRSVRAARVIAEIGGPLAVTALTAGLDDTRERVRCNCARLLGRVGRTECIPTLVQRWEKAARSGDVRFQSAIQSALAHFGPAATQKIVAYLYSDHALLRRHAAVALGTLGSPDCYPHLATAIATGHPGYRMHAMRALVRLTGAEAVRWIDRSVASPPIYLAAPLGELIARSPRVPSEAIRAHLGIGSPFAQVAAATAAGIRADRLATPWLVRLLAQKSLDVAIAAATALTQIALRAPTVELRGAVQPLTERLRRSRSEGVLARRTFVNALNQIQKATQDFKNLPLPVTGATVTTEDLPLPTETPVGPATDDLPIPDESVPSADASPVGPLGVPMLATLLWQRLWRKVRGGEPN